MTNKKAIELLKHHIETWESKFPPAHIEACKKAIESLKITNPIKPRENEAWHELSNDERKDDYQYYCGNCLAELVGHESYCWHCGSELDW